MPNQNGELAEHEIHEIVARLTKEYGKTMSPCSICGTEEWSIGPNLVQLTPYLGGRMAIGGQLYPCLTLTCKKCGNTLLLNALMAGALKQPSSTSTEEKNANR